MKNNNKTKIIILIVFILLAVGITVCFHKTNLKPDEFVLEYLQIRYEIVDNSLKL